MQLRSNLWLTNNEKGHFGKGRIELLEQIDLTGSISKAAKAMKMSYKAAWDAVNEMNMLSQEPIVERETGGKGGGGTVLTAKGHEYIALFKQVEETQALFFQALGHYANDPKKLLAFTSKLTLRTSARNHLSGTVTAIKRFKTNAEVTLKIDENIEVVVKITAKSLRDLDVQKGHELTILLKSSWISLYKELPNIQPEKNYLQGSVIKIEEDDESSEVSVAFGETKSLIVSMDDETKRELELNKGDKVWAVFDISSALLAV